MANLFANCEDPDQTPHSAASDLGLHCLPITLLGVSQLQWINSGWFKLFLSPWETSDSSRKLMLLRDILGKFSYFIMKMYVVSTHLNCSIKAVLMSTPSIHFLYRRSRRQPLIIPLCLLTWWCDKLSVQNKFPWSQIILSHWSLTIYLHTHLMYSHASVSLM